MRKYQIASALVCLCTLSAIAAMAEEPKLETISVGAPQRIEVFPAAIKLTGARQQMQLVVTGHYADGTLQDLTRAAQFATSDDKVVNVLGSVVRPKADGTAEVYIVAGG